MPEGDDLIGGAGVAARTRAPAPASITAHPISVSIPSHGAAMACGVYLGAGPAPRPTVLLFPGFASRGDEVLGLGASLSAAGVNVVMFAPRGWHDSDGEFEPITCGALETLNNLIAPGSGIVSLTGLQYATNLTSLRVWDNAIEHLWPSVPDWVLHHRLTLVYGDVASYHLLVDPTERRLATVLDFCTARIGDPAIDVAALLHAFGESDLGASSSTASARPDRSAFALATAAAGRRLCRTFSSAPTRPSTAWRC